MLLDVLGTARDLGRLHEIAAVLIRHGLGESVRRVGLSGVLERAGRALRWEGAHDFVSAEPQVRLRRALEELGPTFVKLGQLLAGRPDLLPPAFTDELEQLQQHVTPVPWEELHPQLVADLGGEPEERFARFDRAPLGSASIAQVHRARTHGGEEVVVKARRPGIVETIDKDLRLLSRLAELAEERLPELRRYRPKAVVREFSRTLRGELDLRREARNATRLAEHTPETERITIPRIHPEFTRERLCVMEYLAGPTLGEWVRGGRAGEADAADMARRGADAFLRMVFVDGLFHADPHPGNVLVLGGGRLGLLDFGMIGRLSETRRAEFLQLLMAVVERRDEALAELLLDWSLDGDTDVDALRADCAALVDGYADLALDELDVSAALLDLTALLRENDLFLPGDLATLLRALLLLDGMGLALDPSFVMAERVEPFARAQLRAMRSPFRIMRRGARELSLLMIGLPRDLKRLVAAARRGKVRVEIEVRRLEEFGHQLDRSANRVTVGVVTAALIVGTSIALTVDGGPTLLGLPLFGLLGFLSSSLAGVWLLWAVLRSGRP